MTEVKAMKSLADLFKVMGDVNRLRILLLLRIRPLCVCEIYEVLDIALSTLSQHLKTIKNAGLITDAKDGRWVIHTLNTRYGWVNELILMLENELRNDPTFQKDRNRVLTINRNLCSEKLRDKK